MKSILKATACMAVLATSGAGFATAQSANDTVDVSMDVTFSRSLEFAMDGNLVVDANNSITQTYYDEFGAPSGDSQQIYVGVVEGCVHLQGVDRVEIVMEGQNPDPDGNGPYLKYTDGSANDYFLNYSAQLMSRWNNTLPWDNIADLAFNNNPNDSGFQHVAGIEHNNGPLNRSTNTGTHLFGAVGGQTESGCDGGNLNNLALVIAVGERDGHSYWVQDDSPIVHFRSVNDLAGTSNLAADTAYSFSDQYTITISPDLS